MDVVGEIARRCPLPINKKTTVDAQGWILHTQAAEEIIATARYDLVICDRSVLDNFVYMLISTGKQPLFEKTVDAWMSTYDLLVRVPIVSKPSIDGLRSTDPGFQQAIQDRLDLEIDLRNIPVTKLDQGYRTLWLDQIEEIVLTSLGPAQLELI